jgi:hypothetical protein
VSYFYWLHSEIHQRSELDILHVRGERSNFNAILDNGELPGSEDPETVLKDSLGLFAKDFDDPLRAKVLDSFAIGIVDQNNKRKYSFNGKTAQFIFKQNLKMLELI